jgi:hypothetical protein
VKDYIRTKDLRRFLSASRSGLFLFQALLPTPDPAAPLLQVFQERLIEIQRFSSRASPLTRALLGVTPAMEAGLAGHIWEIGELVGLMD